jgi:hypothetical protein
MQNYPNPFNPGTKIRYTIPLIEKNPVFKVTLKIYDIIGREAAVLVDELQGAGEYEIEFSPGKTLAGGVYFYQLNAGDYSSCGKMVYLH